MTDTQPSAAIFPDLIRLIDDARKNALRKVNEELIMLYYHVGEYIGRESAAHGYGDAYVDEIARFITAQYPDLKGFTRRGLYRMRQFYETYKDDEIVSSLLTHLSWTNHLKIMARAKTPDELHFYINLCIKEHYSTRELDRQLDSSYYERAMLSAKALAPVPVEKHIKEQFLDKYVLDFLNLPRQYSEVAFRKAIIQNLKDFLLEIGRGFTFIGEEYRVQVGGDDFYIDLLFYHRDLQCLVAFELKIGAFKPEYVGKMNFYLEALDREYKKEHEKPSVGIILCADKDDEIVEFAMSRSLSPVLVAEYTAKLPDKKLLRQKLRELTQLAEQEV
jgi:predicted nuclease of restriction endonuclease-like (RecB) superfamily